MALIAGDVFNSFINNILQRKVKVPNLTEIIIKSE